MSNDKISPDSATSPDSADATQHSTASPTADRRSVLKAAGLVVLGGSAVVGLAACAGGTTTPTATSAPPTSVPPTSAPPTSAAPSSVSPPPLSPSQSASSSAPAPTGPSVAAADVPVGSGVILAEPNNYVVTQPAKGEYKAFTAICTHQGCRVAEMRADLIHCNCHGSDFSVSDGAPTAGSEATEPLKEFPATVSGNKVYVEA